MNLNFAFLILHTKKYVKSTIYYKTTIWIGSYANNHSNDIRPYSYPKFIIIIGIAIYIISSMKNFKEVNEFEKICTKNVDDT